MAKYRGRLFYFERLNNHFTIGITYAVCDNAYCMYFFVSWSQNEGSVVEVTTVKKLFAIVTYLNMPFVDEATVQMPVSRCNLNI